MYQHITLSTNELYNRINHLQAWQSILGKAIRIGETFTNPLRTDKTPGAYLREYDNVVFLSDHARPEFNKYTCVHALMELQRLSSWYAAVRMIYDHQQFGEPLQIKQQDIKTGAIKHFNSTRVEIIIAPFLHNDQPSFTIADGQYWSRRGVTKEQLQNSHQPVFSVHHYFINGIKLYPKTYPCFAYTFPSGHIKLYCPNSPKELRFPASNTDTNDVWKWLKDTTPEVAIVTKSYKDGSIINTFGINADIYAFQNEGVIPEIINRLKNYQAVIIIYDNDDAGISASIKLANALGNASCIYYPITLGKDTDEMVMNNHKHTAIKIIHDEFERRGYSPYECNPANYAATCW